MIIDTLGRRWTLGIDFIGAGLFCFLAQICSSHTVYFTIALFGVRSFISGVFNVAYIYTSEVSSAPCGLWSCKNRPAAFPGQMSYKATKPGSVYRLS